MFKNKRKQNKRPEALKYYYNENNEKKSKYIRKCSLRWSPITQRFAFVSRTSAEGGIRIRLKRRDYNFKNKSPLGRKE